ncbi:2'-5'-oligoadenylate synthase 1-like [Mytilus edulis]|uniref:2'-5'-oligoadenylate synthase 1-like n=1 Tax=Mytilus edulis TaxID=6550 RepID=UPI0039F0AE65
MRLSYKPMDFKGIEPDESLSCFIDRVVNPDAEYLTQCGKTIDEVAKVLKSSEFDYKVMRTIKGGSIGKGTAVRGLSDVDLIFPISDITTVEALKQKMAGMKDAIQSLLKSKFTVKRWQNTTWAHNTHILIDGSLQEVDIMPILNITKDPSNLNDDEIKSIHAEMSKTGDTERGYYNRCLRPLQIKFIGNHKEKIKRVIRLIKYWIKTNDHTIIKSIAVELLVIRSWEDLEKPDSDSEEKISKKVFEHLRNFGKIRVSWSTYYEPADYLHDISSKPYILDPVDPYNNVISEITNHYCGGSHVPEADKAVMKQVNRLQSDAERAFNSFK